MRGSGVLGLIVVVWLLIGAYAAYDRGYFSSSEATCATAGTIALNVVAGPLNWVGDINPKVSSCSVPNVPPPNQ